MAQSMRNMLEANTARFKRSLDRIAEKYSKLKDIDHVQEVDINQIGLRTLSKYFAQSRDYLEKSASKSQLDVRDRSFNSSVTAHSQLNLSCEAEEMTDGSEHASEDSAEGTLKSLDETWRNPSESELLPEDEDEELQMSLSSRSSTLAELYPTMVSQIERAWHRQTVSTAASSVLRRYRRWRQQSRRLNTTFDITARPNDTHLKPSASKRLLREDSGRPAERMWTETIPRPVPSTLASMRNGRQSPGRGRGLLIGDTPPHIREMDFSHTAKPQEMSLNKAFTGSEYSPCKQTRLADQIPINAKSSPDSSFRLRRLSVSSGGAEVSAAEALSVAERPDIYRTPARHSPFKPRTASALCQSPLAFSRRKYDEDWSRELMKPRSLSTSMSSPSKRPVVLVKMVDPQDSAQSPRQRPVLPPPAQAETSHCGFRRNLSYESSLPRHAYQSPKKVEEDYLRVYHKFVCQNKSAPFHPLPCRLCGRSSEAGRTGSFTSLAALALSPHRSVLRKRHREQGCDGHPQSKRLRYENYAYSPGSKRHSDEMLRRCQSPKPSAVPYSPSKPRSQESTAYLEAWMDRHQPLFFSPGGRPENEACDGFSPRNRR